MKKLLLPIFTFAFLVVLAPVVVTFAKGNDKETPKSPADFNGLNKGKSEQMHLYLYEKDPKTWEIVADGAWGKMNFDTDSFVFNGHGLEPGIRYTLIRYNGTWPGRPVICLGSGTANKGGGIHLSGKMKEGGKKVWLVITKDVKCGAGMTGWNPTRYLFEYDLIPGEFKDECATIQDGTITDTKGNPITTGYDQWGYNYQAHMFNGYCCNYDRDSSDCQPIEDELMMKWNDAWLSNKSCDGDNLLDRHFGYSSYIGSGAWLTNHQRGTYEVKDLEKWNLEDNWVIEFDNNGTKYNHDMIITEQDEDGKLFGSGSGSYLSGGTVEVYWNLEYSTIVNRTVHLELIYQGSNIGIIGVLNGTVNDDGSMSGDWQDNTSQKGTWKTTLGKATGEMKECKWNYFVKIVAAPADATMDAGGVNWLGLKMPKNITIFF